jgi:hypothetical protein
MSTSQTDEAVVLATDASVTADCLVVRLSDGRTISIPLDWYPRLAIGSKAEHSNSELIAGGRGIHWPDLDEDISVSGLLAGRRSNESERSLKRWLASRPRTG